MSIGSNTSPDRFILSSLKVQNFHTPEVDAADFERFDTIAEEEVGKYNGKYDINCNHADLTEQLKEQKKQVERIETSVYQLLGGLFNQGSQINVLNAHLKYLYPSSLREFDLQKINAEGIWPTTRQGDELEAKFAKQRKKYKKLKRRLKALEKKLKINMPPPPP
jgi:predicted RNase H-like nuclease (RuvC/YqgF family)